MGRKRSSSTESESDSDSDEESSSSKSCRKTKKVSKATAKDKKKSKKAVEVKKTSKAKQKKAKSESEEDSDDEEEEDDEEDEPKKSKGKDRGRSREKKSRRKERSRSRDRRRRREESGLPMPGFMPGYAMAYGASPWGPYPPPYAVGHGPPGDYGHTSRALNTDAGPNRRGRGDSRGMDFGARKGREAERAKWAPGQGRNPDLEAEKLTGVPLARNYSEHDDRRGEGAPAMRRGSSPGGKWKNDMFDQMVKGGSKPEAEEAEGSADD